MVRVPIIDLSLPLCVRPGDPNVRSVENWTHEGGPARIGAYLAPMLAELRTTLAESGELHPDAREQIDEMSFPGGLFLANEIFTLSTHGGTHLDAPYHYGPCCEHRPSRRIDEIPLEWCLGDGVVLRFRDKGEGDTVSAEDVENELLRIGYEIKPFDIVLIETGSDELAGTPAYFEAHPGMSIPATRYLVERGAKVIGVDTNGFDLPPHAMILAYLRTGDASHLWGCHMYGREREYLQIEGLAGLKQLAEPYGFRVGCMPIRVEGAGAAWVRAFAIVDD